ncbi:MAG: Rdx family protein [Anaerolineae bacterium]|nr:Rdx family protein [Anaerolineae bacterium]
MTDEILSDREIERFVGSWELLPSKGGIFEFTVNGELLYSKKATGRHAEPGEIKALLEKKLDTLRPARSTGETATPSE